MPSVLAVSRAIASASPVTILIFDAHLAGGRDRGGGVLAGRIEQRQHADQLPGIRTILPGDAQRAEAAASKVVDRLRGGGLHLRTLR